MCQVATGVRAGIDEAFAWISSLLGTIVRVFAPCQNCSLDDHSPDIEVPDPVRRDIVPADLAARGHVDPEVNRISTEVGGSGKGVVPLFPWVKVGADAASTSE